MLVEEVAVVCLQAQRVTGLPTAVEELGCQCHHRRQHRHLGLGQEQEPPVCARASASGGVAAFHNEVLLLHCARGPALSSITITITVSVSVRGRSPYHTAHGHGDTSTVGVFQVDLAGYMMMHSPKVLSFVLSSEAAGAVLTLALHHRRRIDVTARTNKARCCSYSSCLPLTLPGPGCCLRMRTRLRMNNKHSQKQEQQQQGHNSDDESAGFITIEKHGTITRRPPSDNLLTTDDEEDDDKPRKPKPGIMETGLELDGDSSRVEDEFLAMLELAKSSDSDSDLDQDTLIEEAEEEVARAAGWT